MGGMLVLERSRDVMRTIIQRRWLALLAAALALGSAWAAPPQVVSELTVAQVTTVDGKTVLRPAPVSKPGDILEYRARYTNHSAAAVLGLVANLPIPAGTTLVDRSQIPPDALASTDSTHFRSEERRVGKEGRTRCAPDR